MLSSHIACLSDQFWPIFLSAASAEATSVLCGWESKGWESLKFLTMWFHLRGVLWYCERRWQLKESTLSYLLIIRSHQTGCEAAKRKRSVFRETIICRFFSSVKTSAVLMGLSSIRNQLRWTTFCGRVSSHNNQGLFIRFSKVNQSYSETLEIQHILLNELVWNFLHNWFALIMNKLLDNPLSSTHGQLHGHILCKGVIIY